MCILPKQLCNIRKYSFNTEIFPFLFDRKQHTESWQTNKVSCDKHA